MKKLSLFILMIAMMFCISCTNENNVGYGNEFSQQENVGDDDHIVPNNKEPNDVSSEQENVELPITNLTNYDTSTLSNKKHSWYFNKGTNHEQPRIDTELKNIADKYEAIYLGDADDKIIYLTFDEGYENGYTGQILDTLKEKYSFHIFFF